MSQRIKRADKKNELKICKSYLASLESSCSKDDSTSKIKSVSYSSGDQEIRYKSFHKTKNCHAKKLVKSPLVVRNKDADSINDSGLIINSNSFNKHKRKHQHHGDYFLTCKDSGKEKRSCDKIFHSGKNKQGSESSCEKKSRTLECEGFRRFSLTEINGFSDYKYSPCNSFNSERKNEDHPKRSARCNPVSNNIGRNEIKDKGNDQNENEENIKESIEGSARTRGFKLTKKEDTQCIQSRKDINCTKLFEEENFLKICKKSTENLNFDNHDSCESRKRKKCISNTINQPKKRSKSRSRKEKNVENSSKQSFEVKLDKNKKTKKNNNEEIKFTDAKTEEVLKSISSPTTELSFETRVSQESSRKSSEDRQKKFKIDEEIKNSISVTFNSENDASKEGKVQTVISVSGNEIEDKNRKMIEEIKERKSKKRKGNRYKNSRPPFKRRTLRYLIYSIRKIILSDREENKNENRNKKFQIPKENSCIRIKLENEIESSCESSGYDSLQNIQDRLSDVNKSEYSEKKFSNEIEFLDPEKYCVYKIYKNIDGAILLKESQSKEFKKGEYVIGKRILKESEGLLPLLENAISDKNINQTSSQRNNSTQTELNLTSRQNPRKKKWFKKSYTEKCQDRSKKYFTSLESTSNISFPESSDFEQCQIPFKEKTKKMYSPSSKNSLLNFPKSSLHVFKKFTAVDTSDLNYFTSVKIPEDKMVLLFTKSENEKNLESLVPKNENRHLNFDTTTLSNKKTLEKSVSSNIFEKDFPTDFSSPVPSMIPISWMKFHNTEFIAQKINMEEMMRVQIENGYNFIQPAKIQIKKPDIIYSEDNSKDTSLNKEQTKSFKKFFGIFTRKKNGKINFKEKLKM